MCGCPCVPGSNCACFCGCGKKIGRNIDKNQKSENCSRDKRERITNKKAEEIAQEMGFTKTNYYVHGQPVFQKGNKVITIDADSHNGGFWKMADSIENLSSKKTRLGTYDKDLNRIGD